MRRRGRIFRRYVLGFGGLAVSLSVLAAAVSLKAVHQHSQTAAHRALAEKARQAAAIVEDFIGDVQDTVSWSAPINLLPDQETSALRHLDFVRMLRHSAALVDISHLDHRGREELRISRLSPDVAGSHADRSSDPAYGETLRHARYLGPVFFHKGSEPFMTIGVVDSGPTPGVTIGTINLKSVWDVIAGVTVGRTGYAYVVDRNGLLVAHPNNVLVLKRTDLSSLAQVAMARDVRDEASDPPLVSAAPDGHEATFAIPPGPPLVAAALDGREVMFAFAPVASCDWIVVVEQPVQEALAPVYSALLRSAGVFVVGLMLAMIASVILARQMVGPIQVLRDEAVRIGRGEFNQGIVLRSGDELEDLAEQFNEMVRQLVMHRDHLEARVQERTLEAFAAKEHLLTAINTAPDALLILDAAGTVVVENDHCAELLPPAGGHPRPDREGGAFFDAVLATATLPAGYRAKCRDLQRHGVAFTADLQLGADLWVAVSGRRMPSGGYVLRFADISSYRHAEAVLQQALAKERELGEIQRNFVSMTSHQFRTPLSIIDSCAQRLARRKDQLTPDDVLVRTRDIRSAVARMTRLMESTLSLSRIDAGTIAFEPRPVDLGELIAVSCALQGEIAPTHAVAVDLGAFPDAVVCDLVLMEQVVANLLSNAVKFSPERSTVAVRGWQEKDEAVFSIADEGIGIPPDEIDRVFQRFFRARTATGIAGSGIGLNLARQIIQMHGGTIAVASREGGGTVFTVRCPCRPGSEGAVAMRKAVV